MATALAEEVMLPTADSRFPVATAVEAALALALAEEAAVREAGLAPWAWPAVAAAVALAAALAVAVASDWT